MRFTETKLSGAYIIEPEPIEDSRGFFARVFCESEFAVQGLSQRFVQCNISLNHSAGTVRGLHFQNEPYGEAKCIRCTKGAIYDVILDLRPTSRTYCQWVGVELSAENRKMLYVPVGFGHGYQTLIDNTETFYQVSEFYHPEAESGVRWNDPLFDIQWPKPVHTISQRDQLFPDYVKIKNEIT